MKSMKGLVLIISLSLAALAGVEVDSNTHSIKDDIFKAIRSIDYTSINILLSDGTDIDTVDRQGNTPLMAASEIGNPRILDIILSHNPSINKKNNAGFTALMIAAKSGQLITVKKLLAHGADPSISDYDGNTALMLAAKYGHAPVVSHLEEIRLPRL